MPRFDLSRDDVDWTLYAVYWMQTVWMIGAGAQFVATPVRRFGNAYQFITAHPAGQYVTAGLYIAIGLVMLVAMIAGRKSHMARAVLLGGGVNWLFGVFLGLGSLMGPTGVMGWWFCMYVAAHMLLQAALLRR